MYQLVSYVMNSMLEKLPIQFPRDDHRTVVIVTNRIVKMPTTKWPYRALFCEPCPSKQTTSTYDIHCRVLGTTRFSHSGYGITEVTQNVSLK